MTKTSAAAFADIKPKAPSIRDRVYDIIRYRSGISRTQIAKELDLNEITVGSRITELKKAGKVKPKGETTLSTSGKKEDLYVAGKEDITYKAYKLPNSSGKDSFSRTGPLGSPDYKHNAREAAQYLLDGFTWAESREGHAFWDAVRDRLNEIADSDNEK